MKTVDNIPLTQAQEQEAKLVSRLSQPEWKIESIKRLADSSALEYRLRSKEPDLGHRFIRGANMMMTQQQLEGLISSQLRAARKS
jgi:hypothetical protein